MARKVLTEEQKKAKRMQKLAPIYELYKGTCGFGDNMYDNIKILVQKANDCKAETKKMFDSIKEDYQKAKKITPLTLRTYMNFVQIAALKMEGKLSAKRIAKFEEEFSMILYNANINHSFLESYMSGKNLTIVNDDQDVYAPFENHESNEFEHLLEHSAQSKIYINTTLNKRFRIFVDLAEYVSGGAMSPKEFKKIADYEYHKDGGFPNPDSPSKMWNEVSRFNDSYRTMEKYKFDQGSKIAAEFGLHITLENPKHEHHPWMDFINTSEPLD